MTAKKRGLQGGRGIEALLREVTNLDTNFMQTSSVTQDQNLFKQVNIKDLLPGRYQPRQTIAEDELALLAASIKEQGVLQPLIVKPMVPHGYEIIAGERRFRAATIAGLEMVPVIVKDVSDEIAFAISVVENIQREQLNAIEEAMAYERMSKNFSFSHEQIASMVGKSRSAITNSLRLLNLDIDIRQFLVRGEIDVGHAKVLLGLPVAQQKILTKEVVAKKLSVRALESLLDKKTVATKFSKKNNIDPNIRSLEKNLSTKICAVVKILHLSSGKGKIIINYNNLDELDGILEHMGSSQL